MNSETEKLPPNLSCCKDGESVVISFRPEKLFRLLKFSVSVFVVPLLAYIVYDAYLNFETIQKEDPDLLIFAGIGGLVGIALTYRMITYCFTTSVVRLSENELSVSRRPIPFVLGKRRINPKDLKEVNLEERHLGFGNPESKIARSSYYHVYVTNNNDARRDFVNCDNKSQGEYIRQKISEFYQL